MHCFSKTKKRQKILRCMKRSFKMMRIFKYAVDSLKQLSLPEVEEENAFKVTSNKTNFLKVKCIFFKNKAV